MTFDPADPDYVYPHAQYFAPPVGAATLIAADGSHWTLAGVRAVPTGFYLWELASLPNTFRTLPQIRSQIGVSDEAFADGERAENALFVAGTSNGIEPR